MQSIIDTSVFRPVLETLQKQKNLSAQDLSLRTNYSATAISLLKTGHRKLTADFALALAKALGGSQADWVEVFADSTSASPKTLEHYLGILNEGRPALDVKLATGLRRLVNHEIYNLFDTSGDKSSFRTYFAAEDPDQPSVCHIQDFLASRIQPTSYDTRIGARARFIAANGAVEAERALEPDEKLTLGAKKFKNQEHEASDIIENTVLLVSKEHFELPQFIEAEVHPAHTLSLKVEIGNGPVIDPGFNGFLCVRVTNPHPHPVVLTQEEAFLTVRFNLLTSLPLTDAGMKNSLGVERYNILGRMGQG